LASRQGVITPSSQIQPSRSSYGTKFAEGAAISIVLAGCRAYGSGLSFASCSFIVRSCPCLSTDPFPRQLRPTVTASGGDGRLYLRDQDLNEGAALIRAAARRLADLAETAGAAASISSPEMDVLQEVFDLGAMDVGDLRARLGAPKQSLARNLNQLEERGFVTRETDPADRRRRLVTLTPAGMTFAREATERRRNALRQAFLSAGPDAGHGRPPHAVRPHPHPGRNVNQHRSHILAVDDDDRLRDLLKRYLSREGHDVTTAKDAASARKLMATMTFDLVILDVMMPGEDGLSLLKSVREKKSDTPIILLTARGQPSERIEGLKLGADDYLAKPFEPEELALRITSILKRAPSEAPVQELKLAGMIFHVGKETSARMAASSASPKRDATALHPRRPRPAGHLALMNWPCSLPLVSSAGRRAGHAPAPQDRTRPREPVHLQTVRGVGYRLTGE